jgi:hypothetical protein
VMPPHSPSRHNGFIPTSPFQLPWISRVFFPSDKEGRCEMGIQSVKRSSITESRPMHRSDCCFRHRLGALPPSFEPCKVHPESILSPLSHTTFPT